MRLYGVCLVFIAAALALGGSGPDDYEPDNDRDSATSIGNKPPPKVQHHDFFPPPDEDWVKFQMERTELVRIETACDFPTIFNDFRVDCDDTDTVIRLHYATPKNYGGLCLDGHGPPHQTCGDDSDCPPPFSELDFGCTLTSTWNCPDCLPWSQFNTFEMDETEDQPLARNDDKGEGSVGSRLELCLPQTSPRDESPSSSVRNDPSPGEFHWYVQVTPSTSSDASEYEIRVRTVGLCCYEVEPNNYFDTATPLCLGGSVHGLYEFSENITYVDYDLWRFDVPEEQVVTFESFGPSDSEETTLRSDTAFELYVGPDDNGDYLFTGYLDDDGGAGYLSRLEVQLPPAADLLGVEPPAGCANQFASCAMGDDDDDVTCLSDRYAGDDDDDDTGFLSCPAYYLGVTSYFRNPNFPYELRSSTSAP